MTGHRAYSIVIVTYNSSRLILRCLRSIDRAFYGKKYEVVIVDNASPDETVSVVQSYIKDKKNITLHCRDSNYGFAASINYGVHRSRYPSILLINPDVKINHNSRFDDFLNYVSSSGTIVGPMMYNRSGGVERSIVSFPTYLTCIFDFSNLRKLWPNNPWHRSFYYLDREDTKETSSVEAVSGAFMALPRKVHTALGGLDENYFMYLEDIDFCKRAKDLLGLSCIYYPGTNIVHVAGASSKNKDRINHNAWFSSRKYYLRKNFSNGFLKSIVLFIFLIDEAVIRYKVSKRYASWDR